MITEQLVAYIKEQLGTGATREAVTGILMAQGWQKADIDAAFSIVAQSQIPAAAQEAQSISQPAAGQQQPAGGQAVFADREPEQRSQPQAVPFQTAQLVVQDVKPVVSLPQTVVQAPQQSSEQAIQTATLQSGDPNETKGTFALASLVAGLVSIIANFLPVHGATAMILSGGAVFVFAIAGIALGAMGIKSPRKLVATIGMILGILGIIVFVSLFVYGVVIGAMRVLNQQPIAASPASRSAYQDTQNGFAIMPPAGWKVDVSGKNGAAAVFYDPAASQEGGSFRANVVIAVASLSGNTLDAYVDAQKRALPINYQDVSFLQDASATVSSLPARALEFTLSNNGTLFHQISVSVARGGMIYVATGTSLDSAWSSYQGLFRDALDSFVLLTPDAQSLAPQPYADAQSGLSIVPPAGWETDSSGRLGTIVIFQKSQPDYEGTNAFLPNINVISRSAGGKTLDGYVAMELKALPTLLGHFKNVSNQSLVVNNMPVRIMENTFDNGTIHMHDLVIETVKNNTVYEVTGTVLDSTWAEYQDVLNQSLRSFKLK